MNYRARIGEDLAARLVALRRELHMHPELSGQELRTQATLRQALGECGVSEVTSVAGTGLIARVRGSAGGPTVALRGDIDALPISEETGVEWSSRNPGVMHACGHDVHATWAVGAAALLAAEPAAGDVLIVFQPAEELGAGARAVLDSGALAGVSAIFGGHVDGRFDVGTVVAQPGPLAASADTFEATLRAAGGHGARPHETADPIVAASSAVVALQTIVARRLDPAVPGVVTVGTFHAGNAANIIPGEAIITGTVRATTTESRTLLLREVERVIRGTASAHEVEMSLVVHHGPPPVVNSERAAAVARRAALRVLGPDSVRPLGGVNMAAEDFSEYLTRMDGCFLRIGARLPGGATVPAHSSRFLPAEEAIFTGALTLAECARMAANE